MPPASAHQCHISVHINTTYQCPSELPFSVTHHVHQCHLSVPVSAAYQCHLTVPVSAAYQ
ncbi:unnamed protein product [Staurois parvus]|uniref:Uncharacterized protein n=1 Tax=Staurois parvus TaxID=386267 RepID=A0ABN9CM50_9NEOB|nr:unnamed protein product [Staurois parvus]